MAAILQLLLMILFFSLWEIASKQEWIDPPSLQLSIKYLGIIFEQMERWITLGSHVDDTP